MMSASNRDQVLDWSKRQLGASASLVSISERDGMDVVESVERSGTGIKAMDAEGCRPVISIMANLIQGMSDAGEDHRDCDFLLSDSCPNGRKPTRH